MELEHRYQKANENLHEFSSEIERLTNFAIADASGEHLESVKHQQFIRGVWGMYTKRATYANPKPTFTEMLKKIINLLGEH